jgi:copper chaperone
MKKLQFRTNINCGNCINSVTPFLNELDNVEMWRVDTSTDDKILYVEIDDEDEQAVINAVVKAGYLIEKID